MAKIKKIELVEIQYCKTGKWIPLQATEPTPITDSKLVSVQAFNDAVGFNPADGKVVQVNWTSFKGKRVAPGTEEDLTIFGVSSNLIATTEKAIRIRYRIQSTDDSGTPVVTVSQKWFYCVLNTAFPASEPTNGFPTTDSNHTQSIPVYLSIPIAGFLYDPVTQDGPESLHEYLGKSGAWDFAWSGPGGFFKTIAPQITLAPSAEDSAIAEYGGYALKVNFSLSLPLITNGSYTLKIGFLPNEGDARKTVATLTCSVLGVTENIASQDVKVLWSVDAGQNIKITYSTVPAV